MGRLVRGWAGGTTVTSVHDAGAASGRVVAAGMKSESGGALVAAS